MSDAKQPAALEGDKPADTPATDGAQTGGDDGDEGEARRLGWRPKEEFRGDESKWVDAATFVQRGKEMLPFINANNKKLEEALHRAQDKLKVMETTLTEFRAHHDKTAAREYERAKKDIEARLEVATEAGNVAGVKAASNELVDLAKDLAKPAPVKASTPDDEAFQTWVSENAWFETDEMMRAAAVAISKTLGDGGMPVDRQFAEITKRIKAKFPGEFENQRRRDAQTVEGPGNGAARTGKGWSDLPSEAKAAGDRFVKSGLVKSREQYAKEYFAQ